MNYLKGFFINIQFFTRIPVNWEIPIDDEHLDKAVKTFPVLGLVQGFIFASTAYFLVQVTPLSGIAAAFFLWIMTIFITGGIHLDGWIDTSDAYFSNQRIDKRLEIMGDPRTGAFGVLSVIILLSTKFLFIYEIVSKMTVASYLLILILPFLSKGLMGLLLMTVQPAKREGLAHRFRVAVKPSFAMFYTIFLILVLGLAAVLHPITIFPVMIMVGTTAISFIFIRFKTVKWFGGITGDVLGASVEGVELMLWMTIWLLHYSVMV